MFCNPSDKKIDAREDGIWRSLSWFQGLRNAEAYQGSDEIWYYQVCREPTARRLRAVYEWASFGVVGEHLPKHLITNIDSFLHLECLRHPFHLDFLALWGNTIRFPVSHRQGNPPADFLDAVWAMRPASVVGFHEINYHQKVMKRLQVPRYQAGVRQITLQINEGLPLNHILAAATDQIERMVRKGRRERSLPTLEGKCPKAKIHDTAELLRLRADEGLGAELIAERVDENVETISKRLKRFKTEYAPFFRR